MVISFLFTRYVIVAMYLRLSRDYAGAQTNGLTSTSADLIGAS
jgi:hypothetical protein